MKKFTSAKKPWFSLSIALFLCLITLLFLGIYLEEEEEDGSAIALGEPSLPKNHNAVVSNNQSNGQASLDEEEMPLVTKRDSNKNSKTQVQNINEDDVTLDPPGTQKIYYISTHTISPPGETSMSNKSFRVPDGWRLISVKKIVTEGRSRVFEKDGLVIVEAHAFAIGQNQRQEAFTKAKIILEKE